jgi:hypothetical protein
MKDISSLLKKIAIWIYADFALSFNPEMLLHCSVRKKRKEVLFSQRFQQSGHLSHS